MEEFKTGGARLIGRYDALKGFFSALFRTAGHIDRYTGGIQHLDELETDTLIAAGDDEDSVGLGGDIFLGEFGGWRPVLVFGKN